MAQNERETIRQRQAEGIAAAKMRGVRFGKPRSALPQNFPELYQRWRKKQLTIPEFAEICKAEVRSTQKFQNMKNNKVSKYITFKRKK